MDVAALLTSAGINIAITVILLSLYSILRKQPSNLNVYFTRRLASRCTKRKGSCCFERFVPSPSWILKAWETTEDEILALAGMDAVVFLKIIVFRWFNPAHNCLNFFFININTHICHDIYLYYVIMILSKTLFDLN